MNRPDADQLRRALVSPYTIVAVVSLWLTRTYWVPGRYVAAFDTYTYSGPNVEVAKDAYRRWRIPLVNDWIFGGVPHLGNQQTGALYPPKVLTLLFESNRSMGILIGLHMVVLGCGMVALARRLGARNAGATMAGIFTVASGAMITKTTQFEQILVLAWAPLLLVTIHATLHAKDPRRAMAATAGVTAAVLLAGHPQLVYQVMVFAAVATIAFTIGGERWRRLPHVAAGTVLGALIAAPQLVASLLAVADSAVSGGRDETKLLDPALRLRPSTTWQALLGTVQDRDHAVFAGAFEAIVFIGVVVALLAIVGWIDALRDTGRRPVAIVLGALAALCFVWSYGPHTFVFRAAFDYLPGFDLARVSARWIVVTVIVAALYAGFAIDVLVRRVERWHVITAIATVVGVILVMAVGPFVLSERRVLALWAVFAAAVLALIIVSWRFPARARPLGAAVVAVACVELTLMSIHSIPQDLRTDRPFTDRGTATLEWLARQDGTTIAFTDDGRGVAYDIAGLRPNTNVLARVRSIDGYDGGAQITKQWAEAMRRFTPTPATELPMRNSLSVPTDPAAMARMGVRFILLDQARPAVDFLPEWVGPVAGDDQLAVWENPAWVGDAISWPSAALPGDAAPADLLREQPDRWANTAIVDALDTPLTCPSGANCSPTGLELHRITPEHLRIDAQLEQRSIVMVDRQAIRGWSVEVDGISRPTVVVDGLFLGVDVPAGEHTIVWRYHQPGLLLTLVVAFAALVATGALVVRRRVVPVAEDLQTAQAEAPRGPILG